MISEKDKSQISSRGSNLEKVKKQIEDFKKGFPYLKIEKAASVGDGIIQLNTTQKEEAISFYERKLGEGLKPLKFVPASGAASRMFKSLFAAKEKIDNGVPPGKVLEENKEARHFFAEIEKFAFYEDLKTAVPEEFEETAAGTIINFLLSAEGLNYGQLPKGLLKFHKYANGERTPFEEHLVEGALYAKGIDDKVKLHFTVSPEHQEAFESLLQKVGKWYEQHYNVTLEVGFSHQKPSTDTIAVDTNNNPFRNIDGTLLFRPGGHGALIENLNDLDADIVFVKNIDNVVPDKLKAPTIEYKKALAGVLLKYQERIFRYQKELNEKHFTALESAFLAEAANFMEFTLNTKPSENQYYTEKDELHKYLKHKFNRPLRVCGMVKNEGESGGGPFWVRNADNTVSLQIVESSQIDMGNPVQLDKARQATHFNPVDLVCGTKNYKGEKYDLLKFTDPESGFISLKYRDGKELKAMELPGLWNGAMSNWNTLFVEVPIETFNPVKTVNDLLREQHQQGGSNTG